MDEISKCKRLMDEIEIQHKHLIKLLVTNAGGVVGFEIEQIKAIDEPSAIKNGVDSLTVEKASRMSILQFHRKYYRAQQLSTQFVERMPGFIVVKGQHNAIRELVLSINRLKIEIMTIVNTDRNKYERHEFIHLNFPRIMTDQFRRKIHMIDDHVTNCWFNWVSRPIPATLTVEEGISFLEQEEHNVRGLLDPKEWESMIQVAIAELRSGLFESVQRVKSLKLLPIMVYKFRDSIGEEKRMTKNANTPVLLFEQDDDLTPKYSNLDSYIKPTDVKVKKNTREKNRKILNPYLRLVGVYKK